MRWEDLIVRKKNERGFFAYLLGVGLVSFYNTDNDTCQPLVPFV